MLYVFTVYISISLSACYFLVILYTPRTGLASKQYRTSDDKNLFTIISISNDRLMFYASGQLEVAHQPTVLLQYPGSGSRGATAPQKDKFRGWDYKALPRIQRYTLGYTIVWMAHTKSFD
jgi:hypothetical protein